MSVCGFYRRFIKQIGDVETTGWPEWQLQTCGRCSLWILWDLYCVESDLHDSLLVSGIAVGRRRLEYSQKHCGHDSIELYNTVTIQYRSMNLTLRLLAPEYSGAF